MRVVDRLGEYVLADELQRALEVVAIILVGWVVYAALSKVVGWGARRAASRAEDEKQRRRSATVYIILDGVLKGLIVFVAAYLIIHRLGVELGPATRALVTIAIAWIVYTVLRRVIRAAADTAGARIGEEAQRQRVTTLILLGENTVKYVVIFVAALSVLRQYGVDLTPVLAGAGILGLAVGFGAQNLVRDVISGFFITMEGQYAVGDLVKINGVFGRVERLGLRMTAVRQPDGELRYFPNGSISSAENFTDNYVAHTITVPLPVEESAEAQKLVRDVLSDFDREFSVFWEPPETQGVESFETYARVLRVETHSIPGRHTLVEQKLPVRIKAGLERAGYSVPSGTEISIALRYPAPGARS